MPVNLYYFSTAESQRHKQSLSVDAASDKWRSGLSANGKYMGNQWEIAAKLSLSLWLIESIVPGVKNREMEHIPFLSQPWSRTTKSLERIPGS